MKEAVRERIDREVEMCGSWVGGTDCVMGEEPNPNQAEPYHPVPPVMFLHYVSHVVHSLRFACSLP